AHAVADLVVVLREDDEPRAIARARPRAVFALAERRVLADVEVAGGEDMREVADFAEARVVTVLLAGEEDVQRVVEVVAPLRVEAEAEARGGGDDARVVEIALRDRPDAAAETLGAFAHGGREVLQERLGGVIDDGVHGVDAQRTDAHLPAPPHRPAHAPPAHAAP